MKLSELKGKPVVDVAEARRIGVVDDVLVNLSFHQIQALKVKTEGRGPDYLVPTDQIRGIGPDAVTVADERTLQSPDRAPNLAGFPSLSSVLGNRVLTEGGEVLGSIADVEIDPPSGQVRGLEYSTGGLGALLGRRHQLAVEDVVGVGPGVVTVKQSARPSQAA